MGRPYSMIFAIGCEGSHQGGLFAPSGAAQFGVGHQPRRSTGCGASARTGSVKPDRSAG